MNSVSEKTVLPGLNLLSMIEVIRKGKIFLIVIAFLSLVLSLLVLVVLDKKYTSTATVLPAISEYSGIYTEDSKISKVDMILSLGGRRNHLPLYPIILSSRRISKDILDKSYTFGLNNARVTRTLREHLGIVNYDAAIYKLRSRIASFWIDKWANALIVRVTTDNPELSSLVANAYIDRLEQFNRRDRRSNSRRVFQFVKGKLEDKRVDLKLAEEELRAFRDKNRNFNSSTDPGLQMKHRRLQRKVEIEKKLFSEFAKQYKRAAIEMERDTPIINVLDRGVVPTKPSWPQPAFFIVAFILAGLFSGAIFLVLRESFKNWREGSDSEVVEGLIDELKEDLKSVPLIRNHVG